MIIPTQKLDTIGLRCPEPLMLARKILRTMNIGDVLYVIGDDPSTTHDIPNLCKHLGYTLLESNIQKKPYYYYIKKEPK